MREMGYAAVLMFTGFALGLFTAIELHLISPPAFPVLP